MKWKDFSNVMPDGTHAFLSPSAYHWTNYSDEKLIAVYKKHLATLQGTVLHDYARRCIELKQKLPKAKKTLNMYVNDAISIGMRPEQKLYYSANCFGQADAISFKRNYLRIHDLKTGETKASMRQLEVYAALFCLIYGEQPTDMEGIELRIYQHNDILVGEPEPKDILSIMDTIVRFDKLIEEYNENELER